MGLIKRLNWKKFQTLNDVRKNKIEKGSREIKPLSSYKANQLAEELHPNFQNLVVENIEELIFASAKRYTLASPDGKPLAYFQAGQYIAIRVLIDGHSFVRPYSLCSSPELSLKGKYQIMVKRTNPSLVSEHIFQNWKFATEVCCSAPMGEFNYEELRDSKNVIAIAGGSGITPFRSMAEAIADGVEDFNLTILYGSKNEKEAIFQNELKLFQSESKGKVKIVNVFSNMQENDFINYDNWDVEFGLITKEIIKKYSPKDKDYSLFISGPEALYSFIKKEIETLGLRDKFVRFEMEPVRRIDQNVKKEEFKIIVHKAGKTKTISAPGNKPILNSLEENGIIAPSACHSGKCGLCRSRLISGKISVDTTVNRQREIDSKFNFFHPCASFPVSDLEIEIPREKF